MNEMLASFSVEDVSLWLGGLSHWRLIGVVVVLDEDAGVRAGLLNDRLTFS